MHRVEVLSTSFQLLQHLAGLFTIVESLYYFLGAGNLNTLQVCHQILINIYNLHLL